MIRMKSPTPNRRGKYEVHDVPSRRVAALKAQGWIEVRDEQKNVSPVEDIDANEDALSDEPEPVKRGRGSQRKYKEID
jgi:hypothetical protein